MGRSNKDVGGYRGRRTVTDILRFIAIALAVAVVLVVAGALYLQKYMVYTDDGVRLDLPPFLQMFRQEAGGKEPAGSVTPPDPGNVSVVVEPDGSASEPPAEPEQAGFAMQLPVVDVINGAAAGKLAEAGAQALILEMKDASGKLAWHSDDPTAERAEVNAAQSNNDVLKQFNSGDVYTIARVCCFRDDSAPYFRNKLALRRGQNNWRDERGLRWLSPAHEDAQAYIAALCGELGALGFDEIVLEDFHFPVQGNLDNINRGDSYDPAAFTAQLEAFLTRVQGAVEPYGTKVSLRFSAYVLTGEGSALSGVTADLLDRYSARFWSEQEGQSALAVASGGPAAAERTVEIVTQRQEGAEQFQAVLPAEE